MNIVLIGAGNLATNLGKALHGTKHNIIQVYSRTIESAQTLANDLGCHATDSIMDVSTEADVYIIAVKDSVMEDVIGKLCDNKTDKIYMHTAGSMPMSIFSGKAKNYGVLYPMQTFSKNKSVDFSTIPFFIEANNTFGMEKIKEIAESVSNNVRYLSSDSRKSLHLAAVFACNFVNHCYALSAEVLEREGLPFDIMLPLIDETASKVHSVHPINAQTGPAVRYDENVINKQLQMLDYNKLAQEIYKTMSISINEKAKER